MFFSIFVAFVLEAFFVEYSVDKSDLQTSLERKIEELQLAVEQYVTTATTAVTQHRLFSMFLAFFSSWPLIMGLFHI